MNGRCLGARNDKMLSQASIKTLVPRFSFPLKRLHTVNRRIDHVDSVPINDECDLIPAGHAKRITNCLWNRDSALCHDFDMDDKCFWKHDFARFPPVSMFGLEPRSYMG